MNSYSKRSANYVSRHEPTYLAWVNMRQRCLNKNKQDYNYYGGRGITICDRWIESYANFLEDMGERPNSKYSLDRIDNDGNYEPSNCRWADKLTQMVNRNPKKYSNTGERNICKRPRKYIRACKPYQVSFARNRKFIFVGHYTTLEEAIIARDKWLETNF